MNIERVHGLRQKLRDGKKDLDVTMGDPLANCLKNLLLQVQNDRASETERVSFDDVLIIRLRYSPPFVETQRSMCLPKCPTNT